MTLFFPALSCSVIITIHMQWVCHLRPIGLLG